VTFRKGDKTDGELGDLQGVDLIVADRLSREPHAFRPGKHRKTPPRNEARFDLGGLYVTDILPGRD
jgi:hypothetical protein